MTPWILKQAARMVNGGGIIAYPTEAVYGLGCDPLNALAVLRLLELKRRSLDKGLILIAANASQLDPFVEQFSASMRRRIGDTWPGPVTWLLPAREAVPVWLRGDHPTIAVRVTDHPLAAALCNACGSALVSTSANRAGQPAARSAIQVRRNFGRDIDCVLHGQTGGYTTPSEIRDVRTGRVLRRGASGQRW